MILRPAVADDGPFLGRMMRDAGFRPGTAPPLDEALRAPHVAQWIDGWMRDGDLGAIAVDETELADAARDAGIKALRLAL